MQWHYCSLRWNSCFTQVFTLNATAGTTQAIASYNVATSADRQLTTAPATVALGGQLTSGVGTSFVVASNAAPATLSTGASTRGFTTATALPVGKKITIALPAGYFSAADTTKANTFTTGGAASTATASCALTAGVAGTKVLGTDGADSLLQPQLHTPLARSPLLSRPMLKTSRST